MHFLVKGVAKDGIVCKCVGARVRVQHSGSSGETTWVAVKDLLSEEEAQMQAASFQQRARANSGGVRCVFTGLGRRIGSSSQGSSSSSRVAGRSEASEAPPAPASTADVSEGVTAATASGSIAQVVSIDGMELVWSDAARIDLGGRASCSAHSRVAFVVGLGRLSLEEARAECMRENPTAFRSRPIVDSAPPPSAEKHAWQAEMEEKRRRRLAEVNEERRKQEEQTAAARATAQALMATYYSGGKITPDGAAFVAQQVLKGIGFSYTWGSTVANTSGTVAYRKAAAGKIQMISNSEQFGHAMPTKKEEMAADQFAEMLQSQWEFNPLANAVRKQFLTSDE